MMTGVMRVTVIRTGPPIAGRLSSVLGPEAVEGKETHFLPNPSDHEVRAEVDDEGHDEEQDAQGEQRLVVLGAVRRLAQLRRDGGGEGAERDRTGCRAC